MIYYWMSHVWPDPNGRTNGRTIKQVLDKRANTDTPTVMDMSAVVVLNKQTWAKCLKKKIGYALLILFSIMPLWGFAFDLPSNPTLKVMMLGDAMNAQYIDPLHLKGETVRSAMNVMFLEGYRCGIHPKNENSYIESSASIRCGKKTPTNENYCAEFWVSLFADWTEKISLRPGLYHQMNISKVTDTLGFCVTPISLSSDYLKQRENAEETLAKYVNGLSLRGKNANDVFEILLNEGFKCGLGNAKGDVDSELKSPKMLCTKLPSRIKYCYEAKLILDLTSEKQRHSLIKNIDDLANFTFTQINTSCLIPEKQGIGKTESSR